MMDIFELSEESKNIKSKLLTLSGVSLFIALSEALPQKIAILGLDLSENETIIGWFVLSITIYFLSAFIVNLYVELTTYFHPNMTKRKLSKTTGDILGMTQEEANGIANESYGHPDIVYSIEGSPLGEMRDIAGKNEFIRNSYTESTRSRLNFVKYTIYIILPILFSFFSVLKLYIFLNSI